MKILPGMAGSTIKGNIANESALTKAVFSEKFAIADFLFKRTENKNRIIDNELPLAIWRAHKDAIQATLEIMKNITISSSALCTETFSISPERLKTYQQTSCKRAE